MHMSNKSHINSKESEVGLTPLEKTSGFKRHLLLIKINGSLKPPSTQAARPVRKIFLNGASLRDKSLTGLTLIEVLITIAILGFVLFPIYEFLRQGATSWQLGENKTEVVQNARIGLDKMCDEVKHAREFYTINPAQIRFWWKDINDDDIADPDEILTYSFSGASGDDLTRQFDSEAQPTALANYVDNFEFKYYNVAGAETVNLDAVNFITATLRIKKTAQNHDYISIMRKSIRPRNMEI